MDAIDFLDKPPQVQPLPVYVLHGDEHFLKRRVLRTIRTFILGENDDGFSLSTYPGDKASYSDVIAELETLPFASPYRLVVVENADPFVSEYRDKLEKYISKPARCGVLVLDVKTWASNTRLAKQIDPKTALVVCKAMTSATLPAWCVRWMKQQHGKQLVQHASRLLVDLVGNDMGLLDQEMNKLAVYVGAAKQVGLEDVDKMVGHSRMADVFKIFDAIGAGQTETAMRILSRLFEQGEDAIKLLGAFSFQLRRLGRAYRLHLQGQPVASALEQAGYAPFFIKGGEQFLRHLGRRRAELLYDWMLELDQGMKGYSSLTPRQQFERLVVRMAMKNPA